MSNVYKFVTIFVNIAKNTWESFVKDDPIRLCAIGSEL